MKNTSLDELTYQWPPNLSQYEAKIFLGLTTVEAMLGGMAFILPIGTVQNFWGILLGVMSFLIVLASIKKIEKFGDQPLLIHLFKKTIATRKKKELELPIIVGGNSAYIELESWDGETLLTLDK